MMNDQPHRFRHVLNDDYPAPGIPADEAWARMRTLLDNASQEGAQPPMAPAQSHPLLIYRLAACLLLAAAGVWLWARSSHNRSVPEQQTSVNQTGGPRSTPQTQIQKPATCLTDESGAGTDRATSRNRNDPARASTEKPTTTKAPYAGNSSFSLAAVGNRTFPDPSQTTALQPRSAAVSRNQTDNKSTKKNPKPKGADKGLFARLNFGLQWNLPAPLPDANHYFTGTDGHSAPYLLAIPDIWISGSFGENQGLRLLFQPYQSTLAGNKPVALSQGRLSPTDTTNVTRTSRLVKTSGIAIALHYVRHLNDHWSVAAGLSLHWQPTALLENLTVRTLDNQLISDSLSPVRKSSADWPSLKPSFLAGELELGYRLGSVQLGTSISASFQSLSSTPGTDIRPLNGHLFLRLGFK